MKKTFQSLIILFIVTSCCPPRHSIEFVNSKKEIKVLSEDYFLKSIIITEYIPKENYIEEIDSNRTIITFKPNTNSINLYKLEQTSDVQGKKLDKMLAKKFLQYKIYLTPKDEAAFDKTFDEVYFVSEQIVKNSMEFETNGCK